MLRVGYGPNVCCWLERGGGIAGPANWLPPASVYSCACLGSRHRCASSEDAVDAAELCSRPTRPPVPDGFCEDGNSMVATAAFPYEGSCSIPDSMAGVCRELMYTVEELATEGRSTCTKDDGADLAPDMNERVCTVLLEGDWVPKSCGQWETEISLTGPAGFAAYCASDPTGGIKAYVDSALEACCPPGTVFLGLGLMSKALGHCLRLSVGSFSLSLSPPPSPPSLAVLLALLK